MNKGVPPDISLVVLVWWVLGGARDDLISLRRRLEYCSLEKLSILASVPPTKSQLKCGQAFLSFLVGGSANVSGLFLTLSVDALRSRGWASDVDPEM